MIYAALLLILALQNPDSLWRDTTTIPSGLLVERKMFIKATGRMVSHKFELNGVSHGKFRTWYVSGQLELDASYKNGIQVDTTRAYYESGELQGMDVCDPNGDSCTWTSYLPDGRISGGGQSKKGVSVGRSWSKYADGKWQHITERDEIGRYHGLRATWDSLGRPIDSIVYLHDAILRSRHWFPNSSQLSTHWIYDSSDVVNHKAEPRVREAAWYGPDGKSWGSVVDGNGVLRYYDGGKLVGTETFKNGVMVKSTHKFLDDGSLNPLYAKKKKR